ncbi:hypothetical protein D3Z62_05900 [Lachnospiraceae bacterium]|nr:hypothetical protein [Lachnospiraceae bacterium]
MTGMCLPGERPEGMSEKSGLDARNRYFTGRMPCSRVQGTVNSNTGCRTDFRAYSGIYFTIIKKGA